MVVRMKYRTVVPHGWIAIPFCHVDFYGGEGEEAKATDLKLALGKLIYAKYDKISPTIHEMENQAKDIRQKAEQCQRMTEENRRFFGLFLTKAGRAAKEERMRLLTKASQLEEETKKLQRESFLDASEEVRIATKFLADHNFRIVTTSQDDCHTFTEMWQA